MYIYRQRLQTKTPLPFPSSWFSRSSSFIPDLSFILHFLVLFPMSIPGSRFQISFLILHSLYSRPAVPMLCVPSKVDVSPWPFLWSVNLIVSEMEKADLRIGRKRNLSRQKDLEVPEDPTIPECTCSQNSLRAAGVTYDRECAIDPPRIQFSKRAD